MDKKMHLKLLLQAKEEQSKIVIAQEVSVRTIQKVIESKGDKFVMKTELCMGVMGPEERGVGAGEMLERRKKDHELSLVALESIEELIKEEEWK